MELIIQIQDTFTVFRSIGELQLRQIVPHRLEARCRQFHLCRLPEHGGLDDAAQKTGFLHEIIIDLCHEASLLRQHLHETRT